MNDFIRRNIFDRVRQYGFPSAIAQAFRALVRPVYRIDRNIVFIIPDFAGQEFDDSLIRPITRETIQEACRDGDLSPDEARLLGGFLDEGSRGVHAEIDGRLAGYAWVQCEGEYRFGRTGRLTIPPKCAFTKYLFVLPQFRGRKLGQKLNAARLALVPADRVPVVFIIPDNRYAIRNWEEYGFRPVLEVRQSRWLGGRWKTRVTRLSECAKADALLEAITEASRG